MVERNFEISLNRFQQKYLKRHLPRSPGFVDVNRYFCLFGAALNFFSIDRDSSNICTLSLGGRSRSSCACTASKLVSF